MPTTLLKKGRTWRALCLTNIVKPKDVQVFSLEEDDPLVVL